MVCGKFVLLQRTFLLAPTHVLKSRPVARQTTCREGFHCSEQLIPQARGAYVVNVRLSLGRWPYGFRRLPDAASVTGTDREVPVPRTAASVRLCVATIGQRW
jgi:hypothetical protein